MAGMNNVSLVFPSERPVFLREVNNRMYRVSTYFWSKIITEIPYTILVPGLILTGVYFFIGLNTQEWYMYPLAVLISILNYNAFAGIGYLVGTTIHNQEVAVMMTPIIFVPMMLMAGFFVN